MAETLYYTTKDGDVLDDIIWRYYKRGASALQAVLLANPGLADLGPVYASGVKIILPNLPTQVVIPTNRPWGTF